MRWRSPRSGKRGNNPSENSVDAARNAGVDVGAMAASEDRRGINPIAKLFGLRKGEEDDDADSMPRRRRRRAGSRRDRAHAKPKRSAVAAVERVKAAATNVAAQTKLMPHQFICRRGRADAGRAESGAAARRPTTALPSLVGKSSRSSRAVSGRASLTATAAAAAAAARPRARAASKWRAPIPTRPAPSARCRAPADDRVPPQLALAYAEQPDSPSRAIAARGTRAPCDKAGAVIGESETTSRSKRVNDQPKTSVQKAIQLAAAAVKVSERLDNPWLRAIILSPSVHRFLSTLAFGARDFRYLASLMVKPASSVMMTFSADPNRGLSQRSLQRQRDRVPVDDDLPDRAPRRCSKRRSFRRRRQAAEPGIHNHNPGRIGACDVS